MGCLFRKIDCNLESSFTRLEQQTKTKKNHDPTEKTTKHLKYTQNDFESFDVMNVTTTEREKNGPKPNSLCTLLSTISNTWYFECAALRMFKHWNFLVCLLVNT